MTPSPLQLAISNIAWDATDDRMVAAAMADLNVTAIELAPTKVFIDPVRANDDAINQATRFWQSFGIEIVAFQSILFARPGAQLFGSREARDELMGVSRSFIELAGRMGVSRVVFGSPKNRVVPEGMMQSTAWEIALDTFDTIATHAENEGVVFCIEPNPPAYGCNFVTRASEGAALVRAIDRPGFQLHLDAAGMTLAQDDLAGEIRRSAGILAHFHASAPELGPLDASQVAYGVILESLASIRYAGHISIEMRANSEQDPVDRVISAVQVLRDAGSEVGVTL